MDKSKLANQKSLYTVWRSGLVPLILWIVVLLPSTLWACIEIHSIEIHSLVDTKFICYSLNRLGLLLLCFMIAYFIQAINTEFRLRALERKAGSEK